MGRQHGFAPGRVLPRTRKEVDAAAGRCAGTGGLLRPDDRPWLCLQWPALDVSGCAASWHVFPDHGLRRGAFLRLVPALAGDDRKFSRRGDRFGLETDPLALARWR